MGRRVAIPVGVSAVAVAVALLAGLSAQQSEKPRAAGSREVMPAAAKVCWQARHLGRASEAESCFEKLLDSRSAAERAEGAWGIGDFKSANSNSGS